MQSTSAAYKTEMQMLARKKSYMRATLGIINQRAQNNAIPEGSFEWYSDTGSPFGSEPISKRYASLESGYGLADGSLYFLPKAESGSVYTNGIVTTHLVGDAESPYITIRFTTEDPVDLKGITIDFGLSYPTKFTIETDSVTKTYENAGQIFRTEDAYDNVTYIKVTAQTMLHGNSRMRIESILCGIGILIDDNKIVSITTKEKISPIAASLPSLDVSMTIDNLDRYYDIDNAVSAINYMETGQKLEMYHGQKLEDGSVEWIQGYRAYMKSWSADGKQAKFTAADRFVTMSGTYKKGKYYSDGISLYDLAVTVFADMGYTTDDYYLDSYLKRVYVNNPLPSKAYKDCLQLIANAARGVLYQGRDGKINIQTSFEPDKSIIANQQAEYSKVDQLITAENVQEYASLEPGNTKADGTQYFLPEAAAGYLPAGYISSSIAKADGTFESNPILTISFETTYTFYNILLKFGNAVPKAATLTTYSGDTVKSTIKIDGMTQSTAIQREFMDIDKITIEFTKAEAYNRIHVKKILFGNETDYTLDYDTMIGSPKGTKQEKVKDVIVERTIFTPGTELKEVTNEKVQVLANTAQEIEIAFTNPVHGLTVTCLVGETTVDYGAVITESGAYWCKVRIGSPPAQDTEISLSIKGYEYSISSASVTKTINNTGKEVKVANPLISDTARATELAEWLGDFYAAENLYEAKYRGDPKLDVNDLIFMDSDYDENLMIRLEELDLKYAGSLSGTIKGRKAET